MNIDDTRIITVRSYASMDRNPVSDELFLSVEHPSVADQKFAFHYRMKRTHDTVERIKWYVQNSYKILVIIRGCPGSGKSTLARTILKECNITNNPYIHIHSTDNFFYLNGRGRYIMERDRLEQAHKWNGANVLNVIRQYLTPIIVDNTNTRLSHMEEYASMAVSAGYVIEVIEPDTPWAFDIDQLKLRNTHNIPEDRLYFMLKKYDHNVTAATLLDEYNLKYSPRQSPPQRGCRTLGDPQLINLFEHIYETIIEKAKMEIRRQHYENKSASAEETL